MEKWMVVLVAAGFLIPYGTVLAVTGNIHGAEYVRQQEKEAAGKYRILLDREENGGYLSLEEYLPSVLAAQISPDSEMEALKAQAVIARTYIRRQMGEEKEISTPDSKIKVYVIPTNEELMIAKETERLVK